MVQACRGVLAAHAAGRFHGDIKPGNILRAPSGSVMIADFGLVRSGLATEATATTAANVSCSVGGITGTPAYMAPEQARDGHVDALTDVYALGATLYFLLAGRDPYAPACDALLPALDVLEQVRAGQPPRGWPATGRLVPAVPVAICRKAMSPQPSGRYRSVESLCQDIDDWLAHRPTSVGPHKPLARLELWYKRQRALAHTLVLALLLVACVSGLWVHSMLKSEARIRDAYEREVEARQEAEGLADHNANLLALELEARKAKEEAEAKAAELVLQEREAREEADWQMYLKQPPGRTERPECRRFGSCPSGVR